MKSLIERILDNPKSTIGGLLLGAVIVCGVLNTQGVTLGHVGTGSTVTLIAALCTALGGLLAKD